MAKARVELSREAERALKKLYRSDRKLFERVDRALDRLAVEPQIGKQLHGPLAGQRSLRVGQVRIIYLYQAERLLVFVIDIAQRGGTYR